MAKVLRTVIVIVTISIST